MQSPPERRRVGLGALCRAMLWLGFTSPEVRPTSPFSARIAVGRTSRPTVAWDRGRRNVRAHHLFGLTAAGAVSIVRLGVTDVASVVVAVCAFGVLLRWRVPAALVILGGGVVAFALGLIP